MTDRTDVRLERATPDMRGLLAQLLELYSHDLSDVFGLDVGDDGRFGYPKLDEYWASPRTHHAFVFRYRARVAGFALVTRGSPLSGDPSCLDMAEFFILRRYWRIGVGRLAACALWATLPGCWTVRVSEANAPAMAFWESVVRHTGNNCTEESRESDGRRWRVYSWRPGCLNR